MTIQNYFSKNEALLQVLLSVVEQKTFVSVYDDKEDTGGFWVGKVIGCSEEFLFGEGYSSYGQFCGFSLIPVGKIFQITIGGEYNQKVEKLTSIREEKIPLLTLSDEPFVDVILKCARANRYMIELQLFDSGLEDIAGFVERHTSDSVVIREVDKYARFGGISTILKSSISEVHCNTLAHQAISMLYFSEEQEKETKAQMKVK